MGGAVNSLGAFAGLGEDPKGPKALTANSALSQMGDQNSVYGSDSLMKALQGYGNGSMSQSDALSYGNLGGAQQEGMGNALATGATTGSRFAADEINKNQTQAGLYGQGGQLGQAEGKLTELQNQGFNLKPEDQSLYGQESGNIARQFGQQGNDAANNLASRGLSSSGAAGAQFSGLAGNQNEMLAQAQQQIAQQRFQNTQNQIGQYQNFVNSMGGQYNNALNQQYGRQAQGAQQQQQGLGTQAQLQQGANSAENSANMAEANYETANKPKNFMDSATAGASQGIQAGASGGASLFGSGGGSAPSPSGGPSLGNYGQGPSTSGSSFFGLGK